MRMLTRHLELTVGAFSLAFVEWNRDHGEERFLARAQQSLAHLRLDFLRLTPASAADPLAAVLDWYRRTELAEPDHRVLFVAGLDLGFSEPGAVFKVTRSMNMRRDQLGGEFDRPLVFFASTNVQDHLAMMAPDFWSFRSLVLQARDQD